MDNPWVEIRATHRWGFRSGQWALVLGVEWVNGRTAFHVQFEDGVEDWWPIVDPLDPYEFRQEAV